MLKKSIFGVLVILFLTVLAYDSALAVSYGTTSSGWDIYTAGASYPAYRYGPSMIVSGSTIDMVWSTPGEVSGEWDWVRHKRSTDGGVTWETETVILRPTPASEDALSTCDPGIIYFGGYYYIGYTSTVEPYGTDNNVYVARSTSITGPYEKWNGSGWGGNPKAVIRHNGGATNKDRFGAGEPSFVKRDNTLYIYYNWVSRDAANRPIEQTRVVTADATNTNWPSSLSTPTVVFDRTSSINEDSADVKYVPALNKFIALSVARRFMPDSYLRLRESSDGFTFTDSNMSKNYINPNAHNCGITGTSTGEFDIVANNRIAYAYGTNWGVWNTYMNPVTLSADNKPSVPKVIAMHPKNGSIDVHFETTPGVTYKIKYGTASGTYSNTISGITSSPYTISSLTNGTVYYLVMVANNANGDSNDSEQFSAKPLDYSNAPRSSVTASSEITGWEANKAIDGNINTTWSSQGYTFDNRNVNEWIKVDTGAPRGIKRITITPRQPQEYCYNGAYIIEVSADGINWIKPNTDFRQYRLRTTSTKYVSDFKEAIYARYVRIKSTELYFDQNYTCYFQLGEIDIEQVTLNASASSQLSGWEAANAIDKNGVNAWSSVNYSGAANTEWLYIDTGATQKITGARLMPRASGYGFPVDFKFQYSTNGTTWTDITGQSYVNYANPGSNEQSFVFENAVIARYLRLYATKLSSDQYGNYYCQIADFAADTEIKRLANASSNLASWETVKACDSIPNTYWSSQYRSSENNIEWISVDLGTSQKVSGMRVVPRPEGCFPKDFKLQYSLDGTTWTDILGMSYTNYYNPGSAMQRFVFSDLVTARYLRIYATKLRADNYNNYFFQLGEMFVDP